MPYTRFDDRFAEHPKHWSLSDAAFRLHATAIIYCNRYMTDGYVASTELSRLVPRYRGATIRELLDKGLWVQAIEGYAIHDFLDWNASRKKIEADRERAAARQTRWRERRVGDA